MRVMDIRFGCKTPLKRDSSPNEVKVKADETVEALLCRRPNSVKNYIDSLNKQMGTPKTQLTPSKPPKNRRIIIPGPLACNNVGASYEDDVYPQEDASPGSVFNGMHTVREYDCPYPPDFKSLTNSPRSSAEQSACEGPSGSLGGASTPTFSCCDIMSFDISKKLEGISPMSLGYNNAVPTERCYTDFGFSTCTPIVMQKCTSDVCHTSARYRDEFMTNSFLNLPHDENYTGFNQEQTIDVEAAPGLDSIAVVAESARVNWPMAPNLTLINSGWIWIHSRRLRRWVPKFAALFYETCDTPQEVAEAPKSAWNRERVVNDGFWGIYGIYTKLRNLNISEPSTINTNNQKPSPVARGLIPEGACVYFVIFDDSPVDVGTAILNGDYAEMMQVDVYCVPSIRKLTPNNWISGLVARSMGREPLMLINIPLVDGLECKFMPLCATKFEDANFSFEMQKARSRHVDIEYDSWMVALWEFALRNQQEEDGITARIAKLDGVLSGLRSARANGSLSGLMDLLRSSKEATPSQQQQQQQPSAQRQATNSQTSSDNSDASLRSMILSRIATATGVDKRQDNSNGTDAAIGNFSQWVSQYGFDDLAMHMNFYTLANKNQSL